MTTKKFIKKATAIWHTWINDTRNKELKETIKKDLPLKLFLLRRRNRAKKYGNEKEYNVIVKRFLTYNNRPYKDGFNITPTKEQ